MASNIDWLRALELANLLGIAHLAGYHYASDQIAVPNILKLRDESAIVDQWFCGWDVGRKYGPAMVSGTAAIFGFLAWKDGLRSSAFPYHLAASILVGLIAPYTQLRVFPVNDKLLAEHETIASRRKKTDDTDGTTSIEELHGWVAEWKRLDFHRQLMVCSAAIVGLVAATKS